MSKIICDICGTTYPESADICPICGCSRDAAEELLGEETVSEEIVEEGKPAFFATKKKEIFDFDEVNTEDDEQEDEDESGDNRRNGKRQIDERDEERAALEVELRDGPRHDDAHHRVDRHDDHGRKQRQLDGRQGVRFAQRVPPRGEPF